MLTTPIWIWCTDNEKSYRVFRPIAHVTCPFFNICYHLLFLFLFFLQLSSSSSVHSRVNWKMSEIAAKRAWFFHFTNMVFAVWIWSSPLPQPATSFNYQGMAFVISLMALTIISQTTVLRKWQFASVFSNFFSLYSVCTTRGSYQTIFLYIKDL